MGQLDRGIQKIKTGEQTDPRQSASFQATRPCSTVECRLIETKVKWLECLIDSSDDAMISCDLHGVITSWNKGAQKIYGYTVEEAIGKTIAILVPRSHAVEIPAVLTEVAHGKRVNRYETNGITKAGRLIDVSIAFAPVLDSTGAAIGAYTIARDITGSKRAEKSAIESEMQYRLLFESSPTPMWVFDRNSLAFLAVNEAAIRQYGFSRHDFADMTLLDIRPDADIPRLLKHMAQTKPGLQDAEVWRHRRKDGSIIHVEITAHSLTFQGRDAELVLAHDITDRKKAEERLRQSEERFSKAFRSSPFGITIATESEGRIVDANAAFLKMVGYTREDVIGRTAAELHFWSEAHRSNLKHQQLVNQDPAKLFEALFQAGSGETKLVQFATERIQLHDVPCVLAIVHDVTEARRLEEQLRRAQKMEAMGRLAGGIAHDFNNLLSVIIGYCDLSQGHLKNEHPVAQHIEQIKKAGERAASLTRQLLAFSRQQVLHPRILNLNAVVESTNKMLLRLIGEDVSLVFKPEESLNSVRVDLGQIEQVLMNLAVNARDAMPEGGKIVIETANIHLDETYSQIHEVIKPGRYVMLSVSDTGVGMDQATLSRVFEPFFTTKEPSRGTGLGLSTVYGIVKQSNGYIWVYSEPFRGTAVKIYFPSVDQLAESLVPSQTKVSLPTGTETILLVEDDEALRKVTTSLLDMSGYKVLEANNAASAIELSHRHEGEIALLLTDVIMPGKSGPDLALDVKRHRPDISILYASGYTGDIIAHQGVLDPGITLLSKPFSKETLLNTVRTVLDEGTVLSLAVTEAFSLPETAPVVTDQQVESCRSAGGHTRKIRQQLRFKFNVDLNIQSPTQGLVSATSLDISESGVSAVLPIHLPVGEIVELSFDLPIQHMRLSAAVRQNHEFRYGFEFVKPDDATLHTIRESSRLLNKLEG